MHFRTRLFLGYGRTDARLREVPGLPPEWKGGLVFYGETERGDVGGREGACMIWVDVG